MPSKDFVNFAEQIRSGLHDFMSSNDSGVILGLGVNDPKGVFGTTLGLSDVFGEDRVIETPTSENAVTGIGIGLAIQGHKVVMVHQRLDFFLLAMDQLVNAAAKWHYMFGEKQSIPITIRLITGRGWGQGPTHSQNLHSWFAHIPGLKVVFPSFAHEAKSLLRSAINDPNPVIFIEDRWCHSQETLVTSINHGDIEIGKARIVNQGDQLTLVSSGYLTIESLKAVEFVKQYGASVELIDLRSIKPIDYAKIFSSIKKTHKLLVVDSGNPIASIASEIISVCAINCFKDLRESPSMLTPPDVPEPTSYGVTEKFKISALSIAQQIFKDLEINPGGINFEALKNPLHDVPNKAFSGPF